jgi:hypothetical protein
VVIKVFTTRIGDFEHLGSNSGALYDELASGRRFLAEWYNGLMPCQEKSAI